MCSRIRPSANDRAGRSPPRTRGIHPCWPSQPPMPGARAPAGRPPSGRLTIGHRTTPASRKQAGRPHCSPCARPLPAPSAWNCPSHRGSAAELPAAGNAVSTMAPARAAARGWLARPETAPDGGPGRRQFLSPQRSYIWEFSENFSFFGRDLLDPTPNRGNLGPV